MTLFLSTYVNKIDSKGRVSVPASFRASLLTDAYQGFVAFRSYKSPALECFSYQRMTQLSQSMDQNFQLFSDTQEDLAATIFADSLPIPFDGDGRIVLPKPLCDYIKAKDKVLFVGRGATFQIWEPTAFDSFQAQARQRVKEQGLTLPLRTPTPTGER